MNLGPQRHHEERQSEPSCLRSEPDHKTSRERADHDQPLRGDKRDRAGMRFESHGTIATKCGDQQSVRCQSAFMASMFSQMTHG
jgi:hypothetical protein